MPRKTLYISDADLPVFERAQALGGDSLSSVIAAQLRRYVAGEEAKAQGMQEHTLEVGTWAAHGADNARQVRFRGRLLAEGTSYHGQNTDRRDRWTTFRFFQTASGKILVFARKSSLWERDIDSAEYLLYPSLPTGDEYPAQILREAAEALGGELVEWVE